MTQATNSPESKRVHFITHGCQMNQYDSVRMAQSLAPEYAETDDVDLADLIVINTCSVRDKPQQKVLAELGHLKAKKLVNPELKIAVTGCVAQQMKHELLSKAPHLDFVLGPDKIEFLPELLRQSPTKRQAVTGFDRGIYSQNAYDPLPRFGQGGQVSAFVAVQKGCNHFCSYCIVPHVRGREKSRALEEVLLEIRGYAARGVSEVTLLGQNINGWGQDLDGVDFADLLDAVSALDGIRRVRFVTSHPAAMTSRFIDAIARNEAVCDYLHLPIQAGSDRILAAMNRGYTSARYLDIIAEVRSKVPGIAISGDIIVGFPGETEADFEQTLEVMRQVRYDTQFSFVYSPRPGTKAAELDDPIPHEEKLRWLGQLIELQREHSLAANQRQVGEIQEVLLESRSKKSATEMSGRTRHNRIVNLAAPETLIGQYVQARITAAYQNSLKGELVEG